MSIKNKYRFLVNKYDLFTMFQIWRTGKKYTTKVLNDNYSTTNPTIHFIHRYITNNTGDKVCGYYQYFLSEFDHYKCIVHDVNKVDFALIKENDVILVGGGGLLNAMAEWNYNINKAAKIAAKAVIWSAGFNSNSKQNINKKVDFKAFDLVAVRDFAYKDFRYVPCATCALPELNQYYPIKRNIGVVAHKDVPDHLPEEIHQFDKITNSASLKEMIEFIGNSEVVLTNSYHAVYWSILMKKKCVLFAPRSEKYDFYKYPPVLFSGDLAKDISQAVIYPDALKESKALTDEFVRDIKVLLKEGKAISN
jgi:hypothetical protein